MGHDEKLDAISFNLFNEVFPKQKWKCFRNENTIFQNENVLENICETKVFSKRK